MEILTKILGGLSIVGVLAVSIAIVWIPLNGYDFFIPWMLFGGAVLWVVSFVAFKKLNKLDLHRKKSL